jgi:hypothetical protein
MAVFALTVRRAGGQRAEDRRQRTEDGRQRTEVGGQRAEAGRQKTEDGGIEVGNSGLFSRSLFTASFHGLFFVSVFPNSDI